MYNIAPLVIIAASLAVIIYIILKKLPALAAVDLQSLPSERQRLVKDKIIEQKLEQILKSWRSFGQKLLIPPLLVLKNFFTQLYQQILAWERKYQKKRLLTASHVLAGSNKIKALLQAAQEASRSSNFGEAEKLYIEVIKLNHKSVEAYRGLGQLYLQQEEYKQAKETYEFLVNLLPNNAEVFFTLGLIAQKTGDLAEAEKQYLKAVGLDKSNVNLYLALAAIYEKIPEYTLALQSLLEAQKLAPQQPKVIDKLIEVSIILKDQAAAKQYLAKMRELNPENQKIAEWEERIKKM